MSVANLFHPLDGFTIKIFLIAICVMAVVAVAPCQCFSPDGNQITSPGPIYDWRRTPLYRLAAVDDHGVSNDEGGRIRTQPNDGRGDLLGLAHPSDWFL